MADKDDVITLDTLLLILGSTLSTLITLTLVYYVARYTLVYWLCTPRKYTPVIDIMWDTIRGAFVGLAISLSVLFTIMFCMVLDNDKHEASKTVLWPLTQYIIGIGITVPALIGFVGSAFKGCYPRPEQETNPDIRAELRTHV